MYVYIWQNTTKHFFNAEEFSWIRFWLNGMLIHRYYNGGHHLASHLYGIGRVKEKEINENIVVPSPLNSLNY